MCEGAEKLQKYIDKVESLVSSYAEQVLKVQENHETISATMAELKEGNINLQRDIQEVGKGVCDTTNQLKKLNGSVQRHEHAIRKLKYDRSKGHRIVDCPQTPEIEKINGAMMDMKTEQITKKSLEAYLDKQAKRRDRQFGLWIGIATFFLALITLVAMYSIG